MVIYYQELLENHRTSHSSRNPNTQFPALLYLLFPVKDLDTLKLKWIDDGRFKPSKNKA
tara:strand:+ start:2284 stop:2460 length:177 start_codon:yes stop_codon:yes gene_type:complete